ncbi:cysteine desulfurase/sulfurtransferase TusA family protein [Streptomyces alkaliphilus]|uniref:cysteine desulfurase/sulfurtransferase TusA family protein n=1 Tax=Streptomyces alkaliphilus TaxID=1472722 RepID=UPI00117DCC32|nr:aminotransferase class V-fold PLP-dependent enzyme [Streptomyces alkaliphilus]
MPYSAYFDVASTAPPHPVARQALLAALEEGWADPTRLHREGRRARLLLDTAREAAAELIGCRPDELSFTSSGSRALHTGIAGALAGRRRVGRRLVISAVEHSAVLRAAEAHEAEGGTVVRMAPERTGRIEPGTVTDTLTGDTALVCLQSANHEVGTEQPVIEAAETCRAAGVPLLVDAAQSLGWGTVPGAWSLLAASAHKWGGPAGVGMLVVRKGTRFVAPLPRDEREAGRAPGFPAVPQVVAAVAALRAVREEAVEADGRLRGLVDRIRERVPELVPDTEVVGDPVRRLPHLVTFSCLYVDGEALVHALDREGFAISSGSSCTSDTLEPSHVLRAMGVLSSGNVRVSLPTGTTGEEVDRFLDVLPRVVAGIRERYGAPPRTGGAQDARAGEARPDGGTEVTVDALGLVCPRPVIELARAMARVRPGGVVTVLADDGAAELDIRAWCHLREQEFLDERPLGGDPAGAARAYRVRRTERPIPADDPAARRVPGPPPTGGPGSAGPHGDGLRP